MKPFRFRLATLLKLREQTRDERRNQLAEAYRAERILAEHRATVQAEADSLRVESGQAVQAKAINVDRLLDNHRYQMILAAQLANIDVQARKLAAEIDRRRQALIIADREVRVLEKLRETKQVYHRQAAETLENKQFDEIAARQFVAATSTQEVS